MLNVNNIAKGSRPVDDPQVQIASNWRELPKHRRWFDGEFWARIAHLSELDQAQSDRKRAARIAEKTVANAAR